MKSFPVNWRRVLLAAVILFFTLVIVEFNARLEELDRLNRQVEVLREQATQAAQTQIALEDRVSRADSDQVTEEQARKEGRMIKEGDQPVIILGEEGEEPHEETVPEPTPIPKPNWQIWWELYFGTE